MQKRPNIKWRQRDEKELERVVRNFNAKITRELKKHPEHADVLPEKMSKKELKKDIETRSDFKKELHSLERFTEKGAEKVITSKLGVEVTKWEKQELAIKIAQINRQRTIERKRVENIDALTRGKPIGLKRGEMGDVRTNELKPKGFAFDKIKPGKEWNMFVNAVERQASRKYNDAKLEQYKQNYIQAVLNVFGEYGSDLIDILKRIDAKTMVNTYYADEQASIEFVYDPNERQAMLDIVTDLWQSVADNVDDFDE